MNNDYLEAEQHWLDPEDESNPYLYDEDERTEQEKNDYIADEQED